MKQLIRRLSKVADSSSDSSNSYSLLRSDSLSLPRRTGRARKTQPGRRRSVPSGHVPVYVGEEMERFVVNADLMNHPIFVKLLNISAQEYGYEQIGALRIPCNVVVFERVLHALKCGYDVSSDLHDLINSTSDEVIFF
ncbi:hypothetical protein BVRB_2g038100 [Beta vulgaris subsp. vulgaris]|uniref:auxin-responsive protein SAUR71 n=1 Tax=Beta vulgaris subsp. vulgaris TaxID=3555 RepID=UPI00053FD77A|nr:auxin-responsive protein SAUR71 [Beta vulgaris subsp. vulgaris]KMT17352.1 hypothetical protein BVRB_2g038100 [Beta vulgaris subsp. vulgaris]